MSLQKNARGVKRFARLMKFGSWLQNLPNRMTPPPFRLMQIGSAFWQSRVLHTAARLNIATVVGDERLAAEEIAGRVSSHPESTYRLLRMLAAMGVFEEVSPRVFANNRLSAYLRDDEPKNVRAMILMHNSEEMSRPWYEQLEAGVVSGAVPFMLSHGHELYAYMDDHPDFDALFSRAMDSVEALVGDSFVRDFDWSRFDRVIDVGGSKGSKSAAILRAHPHLRAVVVDRAQVIRDAEHYWSARESSALLERMRFEAGDLFVSVPEATSDTDIYLLSGVLHGFDDESAIKGLKNLAQACGTSGARIAVAEMVMPTARADLASASFDMQMFMGTRGRERTLEEWNRLFEASGLLLEERIDLHSFPKILLLRVPN